MADDGVHDTVRAHRTAIEQMAAFLTDTGHVSNTCDPDEGCVLRD